MAGGSLAERHDTHQHSAECRAMQTSLAPRGSTFRGRHSPLSSATGLIHMSTVVHNIKIAGIGAVSRTMSEKNDGLLHRWGRRPQILISLGLARGPGVPRPPLTRANEVLTAWSARPHRPQTQFVRQRRVGVWSKGVARSGF